MLLWTEILRSIPLPTVSLFPENKDIANGSPNIFVAFLFRFDIITPSSKLWKIRAGFSSVWVYDERLPRVKD
jgi:hypothetical protein